MEKYFLDWEIDDNEDSEWVVIHEGDTVIASFSHRGVADVIVKRHNEAVWNIQLLEAELLQAENEIDSLEYELEALIDNRSEE